MRKRSIRKKSVRTIVFSCFALGLTTLLIGLAIYTTSLVQQYVRHAFGIASHAAMNATYASMNAHHGVDSAPISHQVMTIYRGLSPQDRAKMGTVEYRRLFSSIDTIPKSGSSWDRLTHMLNTFVIEVDDVYIAMYDEATSALDNLTQKKVTQALDSYKCTRIVIAHRLSTIQACDRILLLRKGKIEEDGTYEELLGRKGFFAELVERQRLGIDDEKESQDSGVTPEDEGPSEGAEDGAEG